MDAVRGQEQPPKCAVKTLPDTTVTTSPPRPRPQHGHTPLPVDGNRTYRGQRQQAILLAAGQLGHQHGVTGLAAQAGEQRRRARRHPTAAGERVQPYLTPARRDGRRRGPEEDHRVGGAVEHQPQRRRPPVVSDDRSPEDDRRAALRKDEGHHFAG